MALLSIAAEGADALGIDFKSILSPFSSIFGGDDCTAQKLQIEKELRAALQNYTTRQDRLEYNRKYNIDNSRIPPTPEGFARFFRGGKDCKHKNVAGNHRQWLENLQPWLNDKIRQEQQKAQSAFAAQATGQTGAIAQAAAGIPGVIWAVLGLVGIGIFFNYSQAK